ncbi:MAG: DUF1192 domain-containing protein [Minwuia sp.]|uniref:DUF1192 domain-containing protein n=1 Tax=Minwuia sp. TaxID=2493630 RepID=UPI003A8C1ACD
MDDEERARETFFAERDLDDVSVEELRERIAGLEAEIDRLKQAIEKKTAHLSAADAVFKR